MTEKSDESKPDAPRRTFHWSWLVAVGVICLMLGGLLQFALTGAWQPEQPSFDEGYDIGYDQGYHDGYHDGAGAVSVLCDPFSVGALLCLALAVGVFVVTAVAGLMMGRKISGRRASP